MENQNVLDNFCNNTQNSRRMQGKRALVLLKDVELI